MKKFLLQYRTTIPLAVLSILVLVLLAARYGLVALPAWTEHLSPSKTITVTASPLGTTNKPVQVLRTGSVESPKSAPVQTEFVGRISEVYVTEGQLVKAGQPLLKIARDVSDKRETTEAAPAYQSDVKSPEAQANYDNALKQYTRFKSLYEQNAISKLQLETAENRLQAATDALASSQPTTPAAEPSQNGTSSAPSDFITVNAPNSGTVTHLSAIAGTNVGPGQQLMVLDVGEVLVVIHVEQKDLYLLHAGTPATIETAGQTILGQVATIYPEVGANNVSSFRTHINIPTNTNGLLKTGMSVNVVINTAKLLPVHTLPASAVSQSEQGTSYVYLIDNGIARRQEVTRGETIGNLIEITSNLPEQALIVTSNTSIINEGDHLTVQN